MSWEVAQTSQEVLASLATPVAGIERQGEHGGEHSQRWGSRPLSQGHGSHSEAYFSVRCAGRKGPRELLRVLHTPAPLEHQSPELHHRRSLPEPGREPSVGSRRVQGRGARPSPSRGGHLSAGPAGQRGSEQQPAPRTLRDVCRPEPGSPAPLCSPINIPTEREEEATGTPRSGRREGGGGAVSGSGLRRRHLQTAGKATANGRVGTGLGGSGDGGPQGRGIRLAVPRRRLVVAEVEDPARS